MSYNYQKKNVTLATAQALYEEEKMQHLCDAPIIPDTLSAEENIAWREYQKFLNGQTQTMNPDMIEFFAHIEEQHDTSKDDFSGTDEMGYTASDICDEYDVMDLMFPVISPVMSDIPDGSVKDRSAAIRRDKSRRHKARTQRMAGHIIDNYRSRELEAMHNMSFCKKRGGRPVKMPKALNQQVFYILRELDKKNLISDSYREEADAILQSWRLSNKAHNFNYAYATAYLRNLEKMRAERFEREHAMKVMEAKAA